MEIIGKATIHPFLFYSGKICGYLIWLLLGLSFLNIKFIPIIDNVYLKYTSLIILLFSMIVIILSAIFLGKSTRLGLPENDTKLKTQGIYKISRNPMYVGFNLLTVSAIFGLANIAVIFLGIYSIIIYHYIILAEEKFLIKKFGIDYEEYIKRTRRYI